MVVDLPVPEVVEVEPILCSINTLLDLSGGVTYLSLICFAMVKNACSTLVAFLADVSRNGIDNWSAKSLNKYSPMVSFVLKVSRLTRAYLRHTVLHHLLAGQVRLVSYEKLVYTLRGIAINLLEPLFDVREGI